MPVVIKELHIKVNVEENARTQTSTRQRTESSGSDDLVNVCVEKVLEVLKQKKRR